VFSNLASVNILDAAPQVVAALPGMTQEKLEAVLAQRNDPSSLSAIAAAGGAAAPTVSKAYRINVALGFDSGRRTEAEAVILLLEDGDEPYRVLSWRNGSDGAGPQRTSLR
jgi:general secretion pathway protein K